MLNSEQWARAMTLFDEAMEWPADERASRLAAATDDPAVHAEVSSLLAASTETGGFFSRPLRAEGLAAIDDLFCGARIGSWRVIRVIGHGGTGAVYEAARAEGGFDQRAALKIIGIDAEGYLARFEDERAIVARLDHPGIARIYDGGIDPRGFPFMAMEYVDGMPITHYIRSHGLDVGARLRLFGQVCDAVAYAQRNLVLHLDIKPANVLVTSDGAVKLLDFGAARALGAGLTDAAAAAMVTPAYAAPEQRDAQPVTTATDVYALGIMLHELVTGALPVNGVLSDNLDADLSAIVRSATQADPAARYANAGALGADIRRHLAGDPISVRSASRLYVAGRVARRYRWAAAAAIVLMLSLTGGAIATSIEARRALNERDHLATEVDRVNATLDYMAVMFRTAQTASGDTPATAQAVLQQGAANLDKSFAGEPKKYGRVVEFLGNIYDALSDEVDADALERRYLASPAAASDPVTAASVRILFAQSLLRQGEPNEAMAVLARAQVVWLRAPDLYAGELARSRIVEGQIRKADGDLPGAIATLRRGLDEADRPSSGIPAEDKSNLENSLALALMANGDFPQAKTLIARVRAFRQSEGRMNDDLLIAIQNEGAIDLAMGDLKDAELLLRDAIAKRTANFGASGALAAAQANLARVLLLEDRGFEAEQLARASAAMAARFTGPKSPLAVGSIVLTAAGAVEDKDPKAAVLAATARAATAGKPDGLHALSLAVDARVAEAGGSVGEAKSYAASGQAMLTKLGKPGLLARALFLHLVQPVMAVSSR